MTTRWLTFDCYGTLVDWELGMKTAVQSVTPNWEAVLAAYHRHEPKVQDDHPEWTYRDVMAEALRCAARDASVELADGDDEVLGCTLPSWPAFPDTNAALTALHAEGYQLAVLSNVDRELIEQTYSQFAVVPDLTITSADVGSYKPNLAHFKTFRDKSGAGAGHWIHVACSAFHDIEPANELGIHSVYIDRGQNLNGRAVPTVHLSGLTDLPGVAGALFAKS
jgi:2-haloacid dehalogenase